MRTTGRHRKLHRKGCRFMSNEKHNHLDTGKNEQSPTGGPKEVRARIKRLRSRGARVALPSVAAELVADIKPGQDLREVSSWCEGDWLPVVAYAEVEHGKRTQKLVSHIRIRYDPWNKVAGWQEDVVKTKEVTMVTAAGALGLIEPGIRGQVLLDTLKPVSPPHLRNFSRILPGDVVADESTEYGLALYRMPARSDPTGRQQHRQVAGRRSQKAMWILLAKE